MEQSDAMPLTSEDAGFGANGLHTLAGSSAAARRGKAVGAANTRLNKILKMPAGIAKNKALEKYNRDQAHQQVATPQMVDGERLCFAGKAHSVDDEALAAHQVFVFRLFDEASLDDVVTREAACIDRSRTGAWEIVRDYPSRDYSNPRNRYGKRKLRVIPQASPIQRLLFESARPLMRCAAVVTPIALPDAHCMLTAYFFACSQY